MEFFIISMLNGLSYGLLLIMLSSGLTLIFSMMGVLNFAHASFYMLGAYVGYTISTFTGFWPALVLAPLVVGGLGALFRRKPACPPVKTSWLHKTLAGVRIASALWLLFRSRGSEAPKGPPAPATDNSPA